MIIDSFRTKAARNELNLEIGLKPRPHNLAPKRHRQIVERVCCMFRSTKRDQLATPEPYRPGGEWFSYIGDRKEIYESMSAGDIEQALTVLESFWRNKLGAIVKEYATYEDLIERQETSVKRFQAGVVRNLLIWREIFGCPVSVLDVPNIGNPWGYASEGQLIVPKATRFHAHATVIRNLLTGLNMPRVGEIGGGYGGMAYYLMRDTHDITYLNFDLPETLALAAYYLLCCFPERHIFLYGEDDIQLERLIESYDIILLPNFAIAQLEDESIDLFINSFSLSEMPMNTLETYLRNIERIVGHYFLHNNMDRKGVINRGCERIPASSYPINNNVLKLVYKQFDLFHGQAGDYREFLYERIKRSC